MPFLTTFLRSQLLTTLPLPTTPLTSQTIIITGSNTGLGLEAARHFLALDCALLILAVRSPSKGHAAAASIVASTGKPASRVQVWELDMAARGSVLAFVERVRALERVDAVVCNAGILTAEWRVVEGMESVLAVNVVHTVLLGMAVLPLLRASARRTGGRGRLVFVGSDLLLVARFREKDEVGSLLEALGRREGADMDDRYKVSKLLLLYATRIIADMSPVSQKSNVIVNYLTPGACKSDIFRDDAGWLQSILVGTLMNIISRTTEAGSRTLVDAAKPDVGEETHGAFLMDCKVWPAGENVDSEQGRKMQEKFKGELFAKLEEIHPGVTNIEIDGSLE